MACPMLKNVVKNPYLMPPWWLSFKTERTSQISFKYPDNQASIAGTSKTLNASQRLFNEKTMQESRRLSQLGPVECESRCLVEELLILAQHCVKFVFDALTCWFFGTKLRPSSTVLHGVSHWSRLCEPPASFEASPTCPNAENRKMIIVFHIS